MANTTLAGNAIRLYLKNKTQSETDWLEIVCNGDLTLNDSFSEITAETKCGTQTLPGSRAISIEGSFYILNAAADTGTMSERELSAAYDAKDTFYWKIADAYSGAVYQDKEGEGTLTAKNITANEGDFVIMTLTLQVVPSTYVDNLAI